MMEEDKEVECGIRMISRHLLMRQPIGSQCQFLWDIKNNLAILLHLHFRPDCGESAQAHGLPIKASYKWDSRRLS